MDLNLISKQIQFMPDAQLAQSVKNPNGVMPSYLALAELNRRQKIRSSAPQQEPQGTVADEVLQSLHSAGMQPQMPMQQGAPMPQQMGIAQAPGMYAGGLVGYGTGTEDGTVGDGMDEDDDADLQEEDDAPVQAPASAGIARGLVSPLLGAPAPKLPEYSPKQTSYEDATAAMRAAYGPGQDYSEELNGMRQLRNDMQRPQSLGQLQGLYTMASKDPMGGLAAASLAAHKDYDEQQQQYYKNMMENYGSTFGVKNTVQQRNDKIADSIRDYWKASNLFGIQMANGQEKAANDQAKIVQKSFKDANDAAKASTYPEALRHLAQAQEGLKNAKTPEEKSQAQAVVDVYKPVVDGYQQEKRDEEKARYTQAMDLEKQRGAHSLAAAKARAAGGVQLTPEAIDRISTLAQTNPSVLGTLGRDSTGARAQVWNNIAAKGAQGSNMDGSAPLTVAQYKADSGSLNKMQVQNDRIEQFYNASLKNVEQYRAVLDNLIQTDSPILNKPLRDIDENAFGNEYSAAVRALKFVALRDMARITTDSNLGGQLHRGTIDEINHMIEDGATLKSTLHVVDALKKDMDSTHETNAQQIAAIKGRIQQAGKLNSNPDTKGITIKDQGKPTVDTWKPSASAPDVGNVMMLGDKKVRIAYYNRTTGKPFVVEVK